MQIVGQMPKVGRQVDKHWATPELHQDCSHLSLQWYAAQATWPNLSTPS